MPRKLLFIVNKSKGYIGPSETFLLAHLKGMKCETISLIGNPGNRCLDYKNNHYLLSKSLIPSLSRWLSRKLGLSSIHKQDTKALYKYLVSEDFDVVLAEYGPTAVSVMDTCAIADVPLVAHFHGWDAYAKYNINRLGESYKKLFSQAVAVIAVSRHMLKQLILLGANPDTCFYNSCGAEIPSETKANPITSRKQFLMVGRLTEKKAPLLSIKAFAKVTEIHPDAELEVIGEGPLRNECELLCSKLRISDKVNFRGVQSHSEVMASMSRVRCFIQHSITAQDGDQEGTPVGVLEAMGMGLPVVATRHGGIIDVIKCGKTGTLVDERDLSGMVQAMIMYADDAALAQQIGEKARAEVMTSWTSEKSIGRLWGIVENSMKIR